MFAVSVLAGCANPLPPSVDKETRLEQHPLTNLLVIQAGNPLLDQPVRNICVVEQRFLEVTRTEITRRYERATPYQMWRELYEVPLGVVSLTAGLGATLLNLITQEQIPETTTAQNWVKNGWDALNPLMNMQSTERVDVQLANTQEQQQKNRVEDTRIPWGHQAVTLTLGDQQNVQTTDANGVIQINLLDAVFSDKRLNTAENLRIYVSQPETHQHAEELLQITPELQATLSEARGLIWGDLESGSAEDWARRIQRLKTLHLTQEAQDLEKVLFDLTRYDPQLRHEFVRELQTSSLITY